MHSVIIQRIATTAVMPLVAASGWAGYHYYNQQPYYQQPYQNASGQVSINGVTGPSSLMVGQTGTWSIQVSGFNQQYGGSQLSYSVSWGDQNGAYPAAVNSYQAQSVNSSGTFTHTYVTPGSYQVVFTVRDSYGHVSQASATVVVSGGISYSNPYNPAPYNCYGSAGYTGGNCYGPGYTGGTVYQTPYCQTTAGYYDRSCYTATANTGYTGGYSTGYGTTYGSPTLINSSYCQTSAGWYDRSCYTTTNTNPYNAAYGNTTYGNYGSTGSYQVGCTGYYDRSCYVNGVYEGPGAGGTYDGPGGSINNPVY